MTRTIHIGDTTDEEREIYDIVLRSNQALIDAAKAGRRHVATMIRLRDVIVEAGYGDYFTHGIDMVSVLTFTRFLTLVTLMRLLKLVWS